jgi:DNA-binding LytR/AlgR family response regulator
MFTALIAEDEPVLAEALQRQLRQLWPGLNVVATTGDGQSLVRLALAHLPDVVLTDIHMPGQNGLDATEQLAEHWPLERPLPLLCFITAYDHYAVTAFERAAVDYVLKPVRAERLALTCTRLQQQLAVRQSANVATQAGAHIGGVHDPDWPSHWLAISQAARGPGGAPVGEEPLRILQANAGQSLYMVDTQDVIYLEAADKYVRIVMRQPPPGVSELLIRTPLKELLPRLPADQFWQIHRSVVVNARAIERVSRQQQKLRVHLRQHPDVLDVSRMHAHLFKAL